MKKVLCSVYLAMTALLITSCDSGGLEPGEVPAAVMTSFNSKYVNVTDAEWERKERNGATVYEVEFKADNKEVEAVFDANGGLLESKGD